MCNGVVLHGRRVNVFGVFEMNTRELKLIANRNRQRIIEMLYAAKSGHPGGSLSAIDIVTAIYETAVDFKDRNRCRVILSKGHAVPAVYAELVQKGILNEEELSTLRKFGSRLQGHPAVTRIPEVDASTGLLGQGLSTGVGMALSKRFRGDDHNVFVICGDGEMTEGQNYEALAQAAAMGLDRLVLFLDNNRVCLNDFTDRILPLGDLAVKIRDFGWKVVEIDGHDMDQLADAVEMARRNKGRPLCFVCRTVKGKGVSFMEDNPAWHGGVMTEEQYKDAMKELAQQREAI